MQRGKASAFGNTIEPDYTQGNLSIFSPPIAIRPDTCPNCSSTEKKFSNLGKTSYYLPLYTDPVDGDINHESSADFLKDSDSVQSNDGSVKKKNVRVPLSKEEILTIGDDKFKNNIPLKKWRCKICKFCFVK